MSEDHIAKKAFIQITTTSNWLQGHMSDLLAPFGISVQQLRTLAIVFEHSGENTTVNDIRKKMYDPMSNVSRLLNKLMEKGLIKKVRSTEDQRVVCIWVTEKGERLLQDGQQALDEGLAKLACLTGSQFETLIHLLSTLQNAK